MIPWAASFPDWDSLMREITVYFIKRTDSSVYATTHNRYLPGEIVLDTMFAHTAPAWCIQKSPVVAARLKELSKD